MQSDHTILEAGHANLLSRFMEGLQMGWSDHPTLVAQFCISTSLRLTYLEGTHAWMVANASVSSSSRVQLLVEERIERSIADGDEKPAKIGPLRVMVHFEHY